MSEVDNAGRSVAKCKCGHLQKEHADAYRLNNPIGYCCWSECECEEFNLRPTVPDGRECQKCGQGPTAYIHEIDRPANLEHLVYHEFEPVAPAPASEGPKKTETTGTKYPYNYGEWYKVEPPKEGHTCWIVRGPEDMDYDNECSYPDESSANGAAFHLNYHKKRDFEEGLASAKAEVEKADKKTIFALERCDELSACLQTSKAEVEAVKKELFEFQHISMGVIEERSNFKVKCDTLEASRETFKAEVDRLTRQLSEAMNLLKLVDEGLSTAMGDRKKWYDDYEALKREVEK